MSGFDRALLYRLAVESGFRSSELRGLIWRDIDLEDDPPTATVQARRAKNKRTYEQPLTAGCAAMLAAHATIAGKVAGMDPVFPTMPNRTQTARMLRTDMAAADITTEDAQGRARNFHSLRHTFITNLTRAEVSPQQAQELARHSDINLTLKRYTHLRVADRADAINRLPDLGTGPESEPMKKTGTEDIAFKKPAPQTGKTPVTGGSDW